MPSQPPSSPASANDYILLVDDNEHDRQLVTLWLEREGYAVVAASDGQDALDHLRANRPPCLILLDVIMPRVNGFHFRAEQQQDPRLAALPVVMMTGLVAQDSHVVTAAAPVLSKPLDRQRLLEVVRAYCRRH